MRTILILIVGCIVLDAWFRAYRAQKNLLEVAKLADAKIAELEERISELEG